MTSLMDEETDEMYDRRVKSEATQNWRLQHPNIVALLGMMNYNNEHICLVMQFAAGLLDIR